MVATIKVTTLVYTILCFGVRDYWFYKPIAW